MYILFLRNFLRQSFGFKQIVDRIDFSLEGVNWICFFAKKQIQLTPSKEES